MRTGLRYGLAWCCLTTAAATVAAATAAGDEIGSLLGKLRAVGKNSVGQRDAADAWRALIRVDAAQLPQVLLGFDGAGPLAANWVRTAVDAIAERQLQSGGKLPVPALEAFVRDRQHDPRARRLAYEWLLRVDPSAQRRLIAGMLDDPSWEMRRDAVARLIGEASRKVETDRSAAVAVYRQALAAARERDQIDLIAQRLWSMGEKVDLVRQLGYVVHWKLIGPFEDEQGKGFDTAYPPEQQVRFDAEYPGKKGLVRWKDFVATDDYGTVDLNKGLVELKNVAGYAAAEFTTDRARDVEFRITSDNALRVWLNGEPVAAYKIYHGGSQPDQFVNRVTLRPGRNLILVKVCQNDLQDDWARAWDFHLRIVDLAGAAIGKRDEK